MIIDWNGDAVLCCDDWSHKVILGNLKKQSIEEIWFGDCLY
jgi:MoaA/NifB/PqqE/SkfB family radical SAM enzyme